MSDLNKRMMGTSDLNQERFRKLKELFPDLFTREGTLSPDELKKIIDPELIQETERFEFRWFGKSGAKRNAFTPSQATLIYDEHRSLQPELSDGHMIIEGENLETMKLLLCAYRSQVKCIYIDPPYNTGKDFVYSDKSSENKKDYYEKIGATNDEGIKLESNPESCGRFHSKWLNMMYPRLLIARQLLREDGTIFISIDDHEVHHLRKLCDEVFGAENFVANLVWSGGRKNDSKLVSVSHEYVLCYVKDMLLYKENNILWREKKKGLEDIYKKHTELKEKLGNDYKAMSHQLKEWFSSLKDKHDAKAHKHYSCVDARGIYFADNLSWPGGGGPRYEVLHPTTGKPVKIPQRGWLYSKPETMKRWIDEDRIHFGEDETSVPCQKSYLSDHKTQVPYSVIYQDGRAATKRLRTLLNSAAFGHPKDENILQSIFSFATDKNALVLDFFAGSGTTMHAVMALNKADGGNRKCILVQVPEATHSKSEAYEKGYKKISDITIERNKRAIQQLEEAGAQQASLAQENQKPFRAGFKVYKLTKSNFPRTDFAPDPTKTEKENLQLLDAYIVDKEKALRSVIDTRSIFDEVLLKNGFTLNYQKKKEPDFSKNDVYRIKDSLKECLICMDISIYDQTWQIDLQKHQDTFFICLGRALETTTAKWNLKHMLKEKLIII